MPVVKFSGNTVVCRSSGVSVPEECAWTMSRKHLGKRLGRPTVARDHSRFAFSEVERNRHVALAAEHGITLVFILLSSVLGAFRKEASRPKAKPALKVESRPSAKVPVATPVPAERQLATVS